MKLHLVIDLGSQPKEPDNSSTVDTQSFLAAVRYVLKGIWPKATLRVSVRPDRPKRGEQFLTN